MTRPIPLVKTVAVADATGATKALYDLSTSLHPDRPIPRYVQAWSLQGEVAQSWLDHGAKARAAAHLDTRQYEVLANRVAHNCRCAAVARNHAYILLQLGDYTKDEVIQIQLDWQSSNLDAKDKAMLAFADKMCARSDEIDEHDMDALRAVGFDDGQIVALVMLIGWRVSDGVNGNAFGLGDGDDYSAEMQSVINWT